MDTTTRTLIETLLRAVTPFEPREAGIVFNAVSERLWRAYGLNVREYVIADVARELGLWKYEPVQLQCHDPNRTDEDEIPPQKEEWEKPEQGRRKFDDGLVSMRQAALMLGIRRETLRKKLKDGIIPAKRVSGYWRVNPADLRGVR